MTSFIYLNILHIFNDGFEACLMLLLPFIAKDLHLNLTQVGFLGSSANILQVALGLPAGYIASKYGGLRTLTIAILIYGLGYIAIAVAPSFFILIPMFIIAGIGFAFFHPIAFALVAKLSSNDKHGKRMGNFTAVGDVGRVLLSSLITFLIVAAGWRNISLLFGILSTGIFSLFFLHFRSKNTYAEKKQSNSFEIKNLFHNKSFLYITLAAMIDNFASFALYIFLPFLLLSKHISPALLGTYLAIFFVGNVVGKILLGRISDNIGHRKTFIISQISMAIFIYLLTVTNVSIFVLIFCFCLGILTKGTLPVTLAMLSQSVKGNISYEKAFGLNSTIVQFGILFSPLILGYISDTYGITQAFHFAAFIAVTAIIPILLFPNTQKVYNH